MKMEKQSFDESREIKAYIIGIRDILLLQSRDVDGACEGELALLNLIIDHID
jgi:hypothetical protein